MNKRFRQIFLSVLFLTGPGLVWALRVTPTYQVFRLKAGTKTVGELTLTNSDDADLMVTTSAKDFYSLPENKKFKTEEWLRVDSTPFLLKKGESRTISFTVQAPKKAKGELAGNLHFGTQGTQSGMLALHLSLAIYAAIEGTEKPELKILSMGGELSNDTNLGCMVLNTGNMHLRPRGIIRIFDANDQLLLNLDVTNGQPALPNKPRFYGSTVKNFRLTEGKYRAEIEFDDADWGIKFPIYREKFVVMKDGKMEPR